MAYIENPGISADEVSALIAAALAAIPTAFVGGGSAMTLDALHTNFPPSATYNGMYGRVSNLFNGTSMSASGGVDEVMRCRYDVTNNVYRWQPQRTEYNLASSPTGGTVTLTPLVTPPTVRLAGTLLGNLIVNASSLNAYIGQRYHVVQNSTLGLFTTTITGLLGSNITLLGNTTQTLEYMIGGWAKAST